MIPAKSWTINRIEPLYGDPLSGSDCSESLSGCRLIVRALNGRYLSPFHHSSRGNHYTNTSFSNLAEESPHSPRRSIHPPRSQSILPLYRHRSAKRSNKPKPASHSDFSETLGVRLEGLLPGWKIYLYFFCFHFSLSINQWTNAKFTRTITKFSKTTSESLEGRGGGPLKKGTFCFQPAAINNVLEMYRSKLPLLPSSEHPVSVSLRDRSCSYHPRWRGERTEVRWGTHSGRIWIWRLVTLGYGARSWSAVGSMVLF